MSWRFFLASFCCAAVVRAHSARCCSASFADSALWRSASSRSLIAFFSAALAAAPAAIAAASSCVSWIFSFLSALACSRAAASRFVQCARSVSRLAMRFWSPSLRAIIRSDSMAITLVCASLTRLTARNSSAFAAMLSCTIFCPLRSCKNCVHSVASFEIMGRSPLPISSLRSPSAFSNCLIGPMPACAAASAEPLNPAPSLAISSSVRSASVPAMLTAMPYRPSALVPEPMDLPTSSEAFTKSMPFFVAKSCINGINLAICFSSPT